ncbi:MAG: hypothetical protein HYW57_01955 [Ignavibacteriales bacterium]|nr:hypothetical protein [Ignavibacteriales bacterium]
MMESPQVLSSLHFGRVDAETDYRLSQCFVGTEMLRQALTPQHTLFIGAKGSGKSALFRLLCGDLGIWKPLLPKGYEVIFRIPVTGLQSERYLSGVDIDELSPQTANDFRAFWLLYFGLKTATTLVDDKRMEQIAEHSVNPKVKAHYAALARIVRQLGLIEASNSVGKLKERIDSLMEGAPQPSSTEPKEVGRQLSVSFRNQTGMAIITLLDTIDSLLQETKCLSWILLDKLDLLFFDDVERLRTSITGLVQLLVEYSDRFRNIHFKIFLRKDIYRQLRIVNKSHLVSYTNDMRWRSQWLIKLLVARAVSSPAVQSHCSQALGQQVDVGAVINGNDEFVLRVFYSIFESDMGIIRREGVRSRTHEWMMKRLVDGLGMRFPRELIHLGNTAVALQKDLNRNEGPSSPGTLISARALRQAFVGVSEYRCETYLNAEFPHLARHFDALRGKEKPSFSRDELYGLFEKLTPSGDDAIRAIHDVGLMTPLGKNVDSALRFEIPLLYRSGLGITERRLRHRKRRPRIHETKERVHDRPQAAPAEEVNIPSGHFG